LSVDDWEDTPIFLYLGGPDSIINVWEDGRIAWNDVKKPGYYFKSTISQDRVAEALDKLIECHSVQTPLERRVRTFYDVPLVSSHTVLGVVLSTRHYKSDLWAAGILSKYKDNKLRFISSDPSSALDVFDRLPAKTNAEREWNKRIKSSILYSVRDRKKYADLFSDKEYSPEDVRDYSAMFIAEATYFVLFEKLVKDLIPNDPSLPSKRGTLTMKEIEIKSRPNENGERVFVYTPVQTTSSVWNRPVPSPNRSESLPSPVPKAQSSRTFLPRPLFRR
jgi:hypothetical protein